MRETGARCGTPNQRATYDSFSANPPLDRNLMPRQNHLYRERATSIFLVPGASPLDMAGAVLNPSTAFKLTARPTQSAFALRGCRI